MDEKQIKQVYDIASMESCSIDFDVGKRGELYVRDYGNCKIYYNQMF